MRTIRLFFLAIVTLAGASAYASDYGCEYYAPTCKAKFTRYNTETAAITQAAADKKITMVEAGKRVAQLAQSMYPDDYLILSIAAQQQAMAEIFSTSKLTADQQKRIEDASAKTFNRAIAERFALIGAMEENARTYQQAINSSQQYAQARVEQDNSARSTIATAMFLNGVGRAFSSSFGQSILPTPQICTYYGGTSYCQ